MKRAQRFSTSHRKQNLMIHNSNSHRRSTERVSNEVEITEHNAFPLKWTFTRFIYEKH